MRYQLIAPIQGINFNYVIHGHSHVMFLGWVFNMLYLAFTTEFTASQRAFKILFWILQVCVVGMLISFPVQGYGLYSIVFTSLHTLLAYIFIVLFLRATRSQSSLAIALARSALLFFVLSSIGPFFLGYLKASGHEPSNLYRFAIYFYLHFQYNGFFFFGVLSLIMKAIEGTFSNHDLGHVRNGAYLLIASCIPAFFLSTLWAEPGKIFNIIGFISALVQGLGLIFFIKPFKLYVRMAHQSYTGLLFRISFIALFLKCFLQILSAHPAIALLAAEFRSILIAYLHLFLLGFISIFLIGWLEVNKPVGANNRKPVMLFLLGFIGSETLLFIMPWAEDLFNADIVFTQKGIFFFSGILTLGIAGIFHGLKKGTPSGV